MPGHSCVQSSYSMHLSGEGMTGQQLSGCEILPRALTTPRVLEELFTVFPFFSRPLPAPIPYPIHLLLLLT